MGIVVTVGVRIMVLNLYCTVYSIVAVLPLAVLRVESWILSMYGTMYETMYGTVYGTLVGVLIVLLGEGGPCVWYCGGGKTCHWARYCGWRSLVDARHAQNCGPGKRCYNARCSG